MNLRCLTVRGTPSQRGRMHGEAFRDLIQELAGIRSELIRGYLKSKSHAEIDTIISTQVATFQREAARRHGVYQHLYEEFVGIAEGSGLSLNALMVLNNYTDLRDFEFHNSREPKDEGCSTFAVKQGKRYIVGQTWDMHASAEHFMLHLTEESLNGGPRIEILTVTGCAALTGVNDRGVGVFVNNLHTRETLFGLSWPSMVRGMLEQSSAQDAFAFLKSNMPSSGHNYLITDRDSAINVETTGKRVDETGRIAKGKDGITFHTNHYLSPELGLTEVKELKSKTTEKRLEVLKTFFGPGYQVPLTLKAFNDQFFSDPVLCIPPPKEPHGSATCGGMVYDYETKTGIAFKGLYANGHTRSFNF